MGQLFVVVRHDFVFERVYEAVSHEIVIGRDANCDIWLSDYHVSRRHAVIRQASSRYLLCDLDSHNGTYVSHRKVEGEEEISDGTEIRIGPYQLKALLSRAATIREMVSVDESTRTENSQELSNPAFEHGLSRLTPKQTQVFELLLSGLQEKEVATRMTISANTVHEHVKAIYKMLDVSTRGELISLGYQRRRSSGRETRTET